MAKVLKTKDVVKIAEVGREALRFYERKGLVPKPSRTSAGYREYSEETILRLRFIKLAQDAGFTLEEIKDLLSIGSRKVMTRSTIETIADGKIRSIDQKITSLKAMRRTLLDLKSRLLNTNLSKGSFPILTTFAPKGLDHEGEYELSDSKFSSVFFFF